MRRYVDWLIDKGVHGLYPNGSTGEFTRFTVEERRRIIKIVCEQNAARGASRLGWPEANVKETIAATVRVVSRVRRDRPSRSSRRFITDLSEGIYAVFQRDRPPFAD